MDIYALLLELRKKVLNTPVAGAQNLIDELKDKERLCTDLQPHNDLPFICSLMAYAYRLSGNFTEGITHATRAVDQFRLCASFWNEAIAHWFLAELYYDNQNQELAYIELEKAVKILERLDKDACIEGHYLYRKKCQEVLKQLYRLLEDLPEWKRRCALPSPAIINAPQAQAISQLLSSPDIQINIPGDVRTSNQIQPATINVPVDIKNLNQNKPINAPEINLPSTPQSDTSIHVNAISLNQPSTLPKLSLTIGETIFVLSEDALALHLGLPVVAMESTVITHGLPRPQNLTLAREMERVVRENGATPATVAVLDGKIHVGLTDAQLEQLANAENVRKISRRDFATAIVKKEYGGTTVAGTLFAAHKAGIKVFATGGIGGVHEVGTFDISTDLPALADTPMIVVCAGAKAILDLPATLEYLETMGVPVIGYQTDEFPAFYSAESGLPVSARLDTPQEVADFAKAHWELGLKSAVLVCQPPPAATALPRQAVEGVIQQARQEARQRNIYGQALTPFLLQRLNELTGGATLRANLDLLLNNARLGAQIACAYSTGLRQRAV